MIVSIGWYGAEDGLYNLQYALRPPSSGEPYEEPLHIVVVQQEYLESYKKILPHHVLIALPASFNSLGRGMIGTWFKYDLFDDFLY